MIIFRKCLEIASFHKTNATNNHFMIWWLFLRNVILLEASLAILAITFWTIQGMLKCGWPSMFNYASDLRGDYIISNEPFLFAIKMFQVFIPVQKRVLKLDLYQRSCICFNVGIIFMKQFNKSQLFFFIWQRLSLIVQ